MILLKIFTIVKYFISYFFMLSFLISENGRGRGAEIDYLIIL